MVSVMPDPLINRLRDAILEAIAERHPDRMAGRARTGALRLVQDLELSSIDAIQIFAAVDARFGMQAPYDQLLAGPSPLVDIAVDDLARFISPYVSPDRAGRLANSRPANGGRPV